MRNLEAAAESRRRVSQQAAEANADALKHPGGLIGFGKSGDVSGRKQEQWLARQFYNLIFTLVSLDVPIFFLHFPAFATGEQYLFTALRPLLEAHGVSAEESGQAL